MSFLKGITSIAASPFTLIAKTGESIKETFEEPNDDLTDITKKSIHMASCFITTPVEGAYKTMKKIAEDFDK